MTLQIKSALNYILLKRKTLLCAGGLALIFSLYTGSAMASLQIAISAYQNNNYQLANEYLEVERSINPNQEQVHYYLGRIAYLQGDYDKAEAYFIAAIKLNDQRSEYFYWLAITYAGQYPSVSIFSTYSLANRYLNAAQQAIILDPDSILAHESLVKFYISVPGIVGGSLKLAKNHAKIIAQLDVAAGHYAQGRIHYEQEEYKEAEKQVRLALALQPNRIRYNFGLGWILSSTERDKEAIAVFSGIAKLIAKDPLERIEQWQALDKVGRISASSGEHLALGQEAIETYLKRNVASPSLSENTWAQSRLAKIYQHQNKNTQAAQLLNSILSTKHCKILNKQVNKQLKELNASTQ